MTQEWMKGIDPNSIDRAVKGGEILPMLKLPNIEDGKDNSTETLFVKFLKNPEEKELPSGMAYLAEVEHQGARKQIFVPESLRFGLAKECRLHNIDEPRNQYFVIGAHFVETKYKKNTKMYWCQLKEKDTKIDGVPVEAA